MKTAEKNTLYSGIIIGRCNKQHHHMFSDKYMITTHSYSSYHCVNTTHILFLTTKFRKNS